MLNHVTPAAFARKMRELKTEDLRVALLKTTLQGLGYGDGLEIMQEAEQPNSEEQEHERGV